MGYKLALLLGVSGVKKSTYYYHIKCFNKPDKDAGLKQEISDIYHSHKGRYGYRRITLELKNRGKRYNHKRIYRLMREIGIASKVRIVRYNSYKGTVGKIAPNLLRRDFTAEAPNQKWVTDVTQVTINDEKGYISPIIDLYDGSIVSYAISKHPDLRLVMEMIEKAFDKIPDDTGLILHSDQGWQYQHKIYQERLRKKGIHQSMSRKGNCLDNSRAECFFSIYKTELLYLNKYKTVDDFLEATHEYFTYYNNERISEKLNGMTPAQFRKQRAHS